MKLKTSKKEIRENSYKIIGIGYCNAWYLLTPFEAFSYCAGVYGWSCDNYEINTDKNNVVISTGYDYIKSQNIKIRDNYEIIEKANEKARNIYNDKNLDYTKKKAKIKKLAFKVFDEIIEGNN